MYNDDYSSDFHSDFVESISTGVIDANECIYKTIIGHTDEAVDCSVDQTRYDLSHLEGAVDGWQYVIDWDSKNPWNIYPVTDYDYATGSIKTLGYKDTCQGATSTILTQEMDAIPSITTINRSLSFNWLIDEDANGDFKGTMLCKIVNYGTVTPNGTCYDLVEFPNL